MFINNARYVLVAIFGNNFTTIIDTLQNSSSLVDVFNGIILKGVTLQVITDNINP